MTFYCCVCAAISPRVEAHYFVGGYAVCFHHIKTVTPLTLELGFTYEETAESLVQKLKDRFKKEVTA